MYHMKEEVLQLRCLITSVVQDGSVFECFQSVNSDAHDEQGDNPGQEKEGLTVSSIKCDRC